jgi:hypothetical protein
VEGILEHTLFTGTYFPPWVGLFWEKAGGLGGDGGSCGTQTEMKIIFDGDLNWLIDMNQCLMVIHWNIMGILFYWDMANITV